MKKTTSTDRMMNLLAQSIEYIKYILFVVGTYLIVGLAAMFDDIFIKSFLCIIASIIYYITYNWIDISFIKKGRVHQKKIREKQLKYNKFWNLLFITLISLLIFTNDSIFAMFMAYSILTSNIFMLISLFK